MRPLGTACAGMFSARPECRGNYVSAPQRSAGSGMEVALVTAGGHQPEAPARALAAPSLALRVGVLTSRGLSPLALPFIQGGRACVILLTGFSQEASTGGRC